jgi:hypothetical protein
VHAGKAAFPNRKVSLESGASGFSQQLSCKNQAGFHSFLPEKSSLGDLSAMKK